MLALAGCAVISLSSFALASTVRLRQDGDALTSECRTGFVSGVASRPLAVGCAAAALAALAVLPSGGAAAPSKSTYRVQLDGDAALEQVRVQRRACKENFPCTRLVVRDGSRRAVLTPISQRPLAPYNWQVSNVRFHDFTGDGEPEIISTLLTVGGTGSSPMRIGVHTWSGTRATRIFDHQNATAAAEPGYDGVVTTRLRVIEEEGKPAEIELRESLLAASDATCCPSAFRFTRYRFDGARLALVPGSKRLQKV